MLKLSFGSSKTLVFAVLAAAVIAVLAFNSVEPSEATVEARERPAQAARCHTEEVPLDEGYGVSRMAERRVCDGL